MIVNLTPHEIVLIPEDGIGLAWPPTGQVARVQEQFRPEYYDGDGLFEGGDPSLSIRVARPTATKPLIKGLPSPIPGRKYLVSRMVLDACPDRDDLLAPDTGPDAIRGQNGQLIAVRGFIANFRLR